MLLFILSDVWLFNMCYFHWLNNFYPNLNKYIFLFIFIVYTNNNQVSLSSHSKFILAHTITIILCVNNNLPHIPLKIFLLLNIPQWQSKQPHKVIVLPQHYKFSLMSLSLWFCVHWDSLTSTTLLWLMQINTASSKCDIRSQWSYFERLIDWERITRRKQKNRRSWHKHFRHVEKEIIEK